MVVTGVSFTAMEGIKYAIGPIACAALLLLLLLQTGTTDGRTFRANGLQPDRLDGHSSIYVRIRSFHPVARALLYMNAAAAPAAATAARRRLPLGARRFLNVSGSKTESTRGEGEERFFTFFSWSPSSSALARSSERAIASGSLKEEEEEEEEEEA